MTVGALQRTRRDAVVAHLRDPLYRNAYALAFNSAATGALGVLYWIVAAHLFDVDDVGRDSSLIAVITALSGLAQLNFATTLPHIVPSTRHPTQWILRAYGWSTAVAIVVGTAFVFVAPSFTSELAYLRDDPKVGATFVVALAGWGIFAIQDAALAALRRAPLVPIANIAFGLAKVGVAIVIATAVTYRHSVLLSWLIPMFALMVPINYVVFRTAGDATRARRRTVRTFVEPPTRMSRDLVIDYLAGLAWLAYWGGVTVLVLTKLGETSAAHFNIAFAMGTALVSVGLAMGTSFTVEAAGNPAQTVDLAQRALRRIVAIVMPVGIMIAISAHLLLMPFGEEYSRQGDMALRFLGLAGIPAAVTNIALALARVRREVVFILLVRVATAILGLALVYVAVSNGSTTEVGLAWLATDCLIALVSGWYLFRHLRARSNRAYVPAHAAPVVAKAPRARPQLPSRPRLLKRGSVSRGHRLLHGAFYAAGLAASIAVAYDIEFGPLRTTLVLATMVLLPGGLVIGRTGIDETLSEVAFGIGLSLAAWVIGAQIMLALDAWEPDTLLIVLTTLSAVVWLAEPSAPPAASHRRGNRSSSSGVLDLLQAVCLVAPVACLAYTVSVFPELPEMTDKGLLGIVSPWYYVGVGLCGLGFWLALQREQLSRWLLGTQLAVLILVIHALPALAYEEVRPFWAFKHIGVVDYIVQNGGVDRSIDIYHNWPGFFAIGAVIEQLTGLSPLDFARWTPLVSNLLWAAGLLYVMRTLTDNMRVRWLAVFLFTVTNWFVLDYFAPQPLAYFWSLLVLGTMLQWLSRSSDRRWLDPIRRRILLYSRTSRLGPDIPQLENRPAEIPVRIAAGAAVLLMFTAVTFTHQLTPFILLVMCGSILLVRRTQGRGVIALMLIITAAWIAFAWQYLSAAGLLDIDFDLRNSHGGYRKMDLSEQTYSMWFFSRTGIYAHIAIYVAAVIGIGRRVRAGFLDTVAIVLAGAPVFILAGQSYGGEGIYRVMLFSLITVSFLAACAFYPRYSSWQASGTATTTFVLCVGLAALVPVTIYGREQVNYVYPGEVDAALYIPEHAEPGWHFTALCEGFPSRASADYLGFVEQQIEMPCTLETVMHQDVTDETDDVIADFLESQFPDSPQLLFGMSGGQRALIEAYRLLPEGGYDQLLEVIEASERFQVFYENDDAVIFEVLGAASVATTDETVPDASSTTDTESSGSGDPASPSEGLSTTDGVPASPDAG
jgi:O-antigen/teichoic acid export membrane protein